MPEIRIGSRGSALARWQTNWVATRLQKAWPDLHCRIEYFSTSGDRIQDRPLPELGGKGVFTEDLAAALKQKTIDIAVHSLKDLPVEGTPGLTLAAICERADARDVLIAARPYTLKSLPHGARIGTSSLRRSAQLMATRPDLTLLPVRGNIDTRIKKVLAGDYDAILLAAAGLERLGLSEHIVEFLPFDMMLPAPGQGALAVECRADDSASIDFLQALDYLPTRRAVSAERAFLKALGGGCSAPIGAYSRINAQGELKLCGLVASTNGQKVIHVFNKHEDPQELGALVAQEALEMGAGALLA
jgi:hydroxymethylbilane synthase